MAEQLLGVLREVLSAADGAPRPALVGPVHRRARRTFGPRDGAAPTGADVAAALPLPLVDPTDPGAGMLATLGASDPARRSRRWPASDHASVEVRAALVRA